MQLQGYDLVLQVTNDVFQPILEQFFRLPGNEENEDRQFPQELIFRQVSSSEGDLDLHAIATDISMEFLAYDIIRLRIPFERSQWKVPTLEPASNIAGELVMLVPFQMTNVPTRINGQTVTVARLEIPDQTIALQVNLTDESYAILNQTWGFTRTTVNAFRDGIQGQIAEIIRARFLPIVLNDVPLHTDSGHGTLNPMRPLQLEAHTIYNAVHERWDLAMLGMMISGKAPGQSAGLPSAIVDRSRNIVAGISEEAINKLLLAAPLANALNVTVGGLPPEFGTGRPLLGEYSVIGKLLLDSLQTTLQPATNTIRFDVDISGTGDDFLVDSLTADGNIRIGIALENGSLTTNYQGSHVNVDFDLTLTGYLIGGFGIAAEIIEEQLDNFVSLQAQQALEGLTFDIPLNFSTDNYGGLSVVLDAMDICSTEAIALYGHLESNAQPLPAQPSIQLSENLVEQSHTLIGEHTYIVEENAFCEFMRENTYVMRDFDVEQKSTIRPTTRLLGKPVRYTWEIDGQVLSETDGTVRFTNTVWAYDPSDPTGEEEIVGQKEVEVGYKIFDNRLELYNRPEDASHSFAVVCIARDPGNYTAIGMVWVDFQGKQGEGYRDFDRDLNQCWAGVVANLPDPREFEEEAIYPIRWYTLLPMIPLCDPLGWGWIRIPGIWDSLLDHLQNPSILEMNGRLFNAPVLDFNPHTSHRRDRLTDSTYLSHMVKTFKGIEARYVDYYAFANPVKQLGGGGGQSHGGMTSQMG